MDVLFQPVQKIIHFTQIFPYLYNHGIQASIQSWWIWSRFQKQNSCHVWSKDCKVNVIIFIVPLFLVSISSEKCKIVLGIPHGNNYKLRNKYYFDQYHYIVLRKVYIECAFLINIITLYYGKFTLNACTAYVKNVAHVLVIRNLLQQRNNWQRNIQHVSTPLPAEGLWKSPSISWHTGYCIDTYLYKEYTAAPVVLTKLHMTHQMATVSRQTTVTGSSNFKLVWYVQPQTQP